MRQSCVCSTASSGASINLPYTFLEIWKRSCHLLCCLWLPWLCENFSLSVYVQMHPPGEGGCVPKILWRQRSRTQLWGGTPVSLDSEQLEISELLSPESRCLVLCEGHGIPCVTGGRTLTAWGRVSWLPEEGAGGGSQVCRRCFPTAVSETFNSWFPPNSLQIAKTQQLFVAKGMEGHPWAVLLAKLTFSKLREYSTMQYCEPCEPEINVSSSA